MCEGAVEALNNINDYTATIPAGQVGVWAGSGTATVKADNFKATSLATFGDVDGRWFSSDGGASVTGGKLELSNADDVEQQTVRRGFRGGKYIMEYDHPVVSLNKNGVVLHWQDPENFMIVLFDKGVSNVTPRLAKREGGDYTAISSGSAFSMLRAPKAEARRGDRVRIVIQDDPGNSALQELQVDVNGTVRLTSTAIDDDWSAGSVGFYAKSGSGGTLGYDNLKIGYDNEGAQGGSPNADDDIADAGDDIQIDDDFASSAMTLTYDDNGNLTDDGIFKFVYDAWNRLVKVQRRPEPTETKSLVATYAYDGTNRRASKVVANTGVETYPNDGGETTVHFYYGGVEPEPTPFGGLMPKCWNIFETRNGSNQSTWQYFWGTQYVDEIILTDKNGDPTVGNDTDPDGTAGEGGESPRDHRYFFHQDRNWNAVALTDHGISVNGATVERAVFEPYGAFLRSATDRSSTRLSPFGFVFEWAGLLSDPETLRSVSRLRQADGALGRFQQRDPLLQLLLNPALRGRTSLWEAICTATDQEREPIPSCIVRELDGGYAPRGDNHLSGASSYELLQSSPTRYTDPSGLAVACGSVICDCLGGFIQIPVRVYGNSRRAKAIFGLTPSKHGCVTLAEGNSAGIYCTGSCSAIKDWMAAETVPILRHECCHACDYLTRGLLDYLAHAIADDCNKRPAGAITTW